MEEKEEVQYPTKLFIIFTLFFIVDIYGSLLEPRASFVEILNDAIFYFSIPVLCYLLNKKWIFLESRNLQALFLSLKYYIYLVFVSFCFNIILGIVEELTGLSNTSVGLIGQLLVVGTALAISLRGAKNLDVNWSIFPLMSSVAVLFLKLPTILLVIDDKSTTFFLLGALLFGFILHYTFIKDSLTRMMFLEKSWKIEPI